MGLDIVSRHRNAIYGFSILWIVLFHAAAINGVDYSFGHRSLTLFSQFMGAGNVGVDVFLFLSGVCLYFSFVRKPDIIAFMKKRLRRVVPAAWIVFGVYWLVRDWILAGDPAGFLSRMTLMRFWMTGDQSMWFVSLILVLYAAYPYLYLWFFGTDGKEAHAGRFITALVAVYAFVVLLSLANGDLYDQVEIAITRIPVFVVGIWMGKFVYEKRKVAKAWVVVAIVAMVAFFYLKFAGVVHGQMSRFFGLVGGLGISYSLALLFCLFDRWKEPVKRPLYRFLAWTGGFSLELYLTHIMFNQVLRMLPFYEKGDLVQYLAMAVLAFIAAWAVMKLVNCIVLRRSAKVQDKE